MTARKARLVAFYLPQYHPIPENDAWWGKGFTEWTNTAKAKPMFRGHYQPHVPADLGFYDLRVPETRAAQAALAREHGIEAFCYYHYWFAGRRILERPFQEVLTSGEPDFPFCLCWANETWTGIWHGAPDRILIEQTYPGEADHRVHFAMLLPAFADPRYLRVDGKPIFLIYKPEKLPDSRAVLDLWRDMAVQAGLPGLHLVAMSSRPAWNPAPHGFDATVNGPLILTRPWVSRRQPIKWLRKRYEEAIGLPTIIPFEKIVREQMPAKMTTHEAYPCLVHAWDNTPRAGKNGVVLQGSTPALFGELLRGALQAVEDLDTDHKLVFLKSWNEWAEGNHLEPDLKYEKNYLSEIKILQP